MTLDAFLRGETSEFRAAPADQPDQRWPTSPRPVRSDPFPRTSLFDRRTLRIGSVISFLALVCLGLLGGAITGIVLR